VSLHPRIRILGPRAFLTKEHFARLFGVDARLEFQHALGQQAGFLGVQELGAATALGRLTGIPIVGPLGGPSRLECPAGAASALGLDPPVRHSGDVEGAPRVTLLGPRGHLELDHGVISLTRRLACSPENARRLGFLEGDRALCALRSRRRSEVREAVRDAILGEIFVHITDEWDLELLLDSDDAHALRLVDGDTARLLSGGAGDGAAGRLATGRLVSEKDIRAAREQGLRIRVTRGMLVTPAARELGREWDVLDFEA
jgi:propanediol utilization protein